MTIQTKFDPGQEVWFMDAPKKPHQTACAKIEFIKTHTDDAVTLTVYYVSNLWRDEEYLFPSKSELLASL